MTGPQTPPALLHRVDVYWPHCERYFRGTLVQALPNNPFTFYVHYDDNDYQRTDLNNVRWHYVSRTCCKGDQDVLLAHDFMPGRVQRLFGKKKKPGRLQHGVIKRRRSSRVASAKARRSSGGSQDTSVPLEACSVVHSSDCQVGALREDNTGLKGDVALGRDPKDKSSAQAVGGRGMETGNGNGREMEKRDGFTHWKKALLSRFQAIDRA